MELYLEHRDSLGLTDSAARAVSSCSIEDRLSQVEIIPVALYTCMNPYPHDVPHFLVSAGCYHQPNGEHIDQY